MTKNQAYKIVIKDLKSHTKCEEYSFGCWDCAEKRLAEDLESIMDFEDSQRWGKTK